MKKLTDNPNIHVEKLPLMPFDVIYNSSIIYMKEITWEHGIKTIDPKKDIIVSINQN